MTIRIISPALCLFSSILLSAQEMPSPSVRELLPSDAVVIESANLRAVTTGKDRLLVLWMRNPMKDVRAPDAGYCGDAVYGDNWVGPTRLSLIDSTNRKVLNTISILGPAFLRDPDDSFRLPFKVGTYYYHVPGVDPNQSDKEGKPTLLYLRDFTGDGVAAEFVLFEYGACGIAGTSVFGYQKQLDQVVQYSVEVTSGKGKTEVVKWVDQIFGVPPIKPGQWDFSWSPGHGSDVMIHEQISFDRVRQRFVDH